MVIESLLCFQSNPHAAASQPRFNDPLQRAQTLPSFVPITKWETSPPSVSFIALRYFWPLSHQIFDTATVNI